MFDGQTVRVVEAQVLVEHGEDLVVENLEFADAVNHLLQRLRQKRQHHVGDGGWAEQSPRLSPPGGIPLPAILGKFSAPK